MTSTASRRRARALAVAAALVASGAARGQVLTELPPFVLDGGGP